MKRRSRAAFATAIATLVIAAAFVLVACHAGAKEDSHTRVGGGTNLPAFLGEIPRGSFTRVGQTVQDWQPVAGDAAIILDGSEIGPLATNEHAAYATFVEAEYADAAACNDAGNCGAYWQLKYFGKLNPGGVFSDFTGHTTSSTVDTQVGSLLTGATASITYTDAGTLGVRVYCPVPCVAGANPDYIRRSAYGPPPIPQVLSVAQAQYATTYTTSVPVVITTTTGAATSVSAATYAGVALTGCTATNDHTATCSLPAGTRTATTNQPVTLTSPAAPLPCAHCGNLVQAAVTGISPTSGPTAGGTAVTITLNAGATGGCTTLPQLCSAGASSCANVSGCSVVDDQHITATSGVGTLGTGNVNVFSGSSPTAAANAWSYANPPPTLNVLAYPLLSRADGNGQLKTLPGNNLSGITGTGGTGVTVNGVAATSVSSTATSVTFKPPANTASGSTAYSIVVTGPYGSDTAKLGATWSNTTNVIYYLPTSTIAVWTCAEGVTTATGTSNAVDVIAGQAIAQATGSAQPPIASINSGKYCEFTFNGSQSLATAAGYTPFSAQPFGISLAGYHAAGAAVQNWVSTAGATEINAYYDGAHVCIYAGASPACSLTSTARNWIYWTFNGASSGVNVGGTSGGFGNAGTANPTGILSIGVGLTGGASVIVLDGSTANSALLHTLLTTLTGVT